MAKEIKRTYPKGVKFPEGIVDSDRDKLSGIIYLELVGSPGAEKDRFLKRNNNCPYGSMWRYQLKIGSNLYVGGVFATYFGPEEDNWKVIERNLGPDDEKQKDRVLISRYRGEAGIGNFMKARAISIRESLAHSTGLPYLEEIIDVNKQDPYLFQFINSPSL